VVLFIGGIKSGKSRNAEEYALNNSNGDIIYLATTEFFDDEMSSRVERHQSQRDKRFITVEEPLQISNIAKKYPNQTILIECISMWINNMLYHKFNQDDIIDEVKKLISLNSNIVVVINDVSCSVISEYKLVREFVDINGIVSQILATHSSKVYNNISGISIQIK